MPSTAPWLAAAEAMFNRNIDACSRAASLARRLNGTSLQVNVPGFARVRAAFLGGRMALASGDDSPADAVITGTAPALFAMMRAGAAARPGSPRAAVEIRGDAEIANLYREVFSAARPDWEEELSRWVGDLPARSLSRFAQGAAAWMRRTRRVAGENLAEYLQEESRDLPSRTEIDEFLQGVDEVRESADRVAARLKALQRRLEVDP